MSIVRVAPVLRDAAGQTAAKRLQVIILVNNINLTAWGYPECFIGMKGSACRIEPSDLHSFEAASNYY
jgi:hypothetical protein